MNNVRSLMLATVLSGISSPAWSADVLKYGPAPSWITPLPLPKDPAKTEAPVAILMQDQQITFEPGKLIVYSESAIRIQSATGLGAGNISLPWRPETDTVTVNKLQILRGGETIDVLAAGQTFNVLRRETNLEQATLDGMLTANIQPEGLQEGDVIVLALTVEHVDPVTKSHVEASFGEWNLIQYQLGRVRVNWPDSVKLRFRSAGGLPALKQSKRDGRNIAELSLTNIEPQIAPKSAPPRFQIGRVIEASDFSTWSELSDLMLPLYREAAVIPAQGPLRAELEKIRSASKDPKKRAQDALKLVQDRIRYVALLMGQGGYVPASAETTWSRRFGDCKAKTAMLLALLRELGIEADPILVTAFAGDALPERLPMLGLFNHVLVRANIGGNTYWLDGTRSGDLSLDLIPDPSFRWGLPLVANAKLVPISERPLTIPDVDTSVQIDASNGIFADAAFKAERIIRGDFARTSNVSLSGMSPTQLEEFKRKYWKNIYDDVILKSATHSFDAAKSELRLAMTGTGKLEWDDGWYSVPHSGLAFDPDFERPEGPNRKAPFEVSHPSFSRSSVEIKLPKGFDPGQSKVPAPVNEQLAGVEYHRAVQIENGTLVLDRSERSVASETSYQDALAVTARLKALSDDDVYLRVPEIYPASAADLEAKQAEKLASWGDFFDRGWLLTQNGKLEAGIADFTESHKLNPTAIWPVSNRALNYAMLGKWDLAQKDVDTASAIQADNAAVLRVKGMIAEHKGDFAAAADAFSKSLVKDPGNQWGILGRANALQKLGRTAEAQRAFDEVVERNPGNDVALAYRAQAYVAQSNYDAAEKDATAALSKNPENHIALAARAEVASVKGDTKTIVEIYRKAVEKNPGNDYARTQLAKAYRDLGDDENALAEAERALKTIKDSSELRLLRANIMLVRGSPDEVAREAAALSDENKDSDFAQVAAGKIFAKLGKYGEADAAFARALALTKEAYVHINQAQARPYRDYSAKLADLDAALRADPRSFDAYSEKAAVLMRKGDYDRALATYDEALKQGPLSDTATGQTAQFVALSRAQVLHKAGRRAEAEKIFSEERAQAKDYLDYYRLCFTKVQVGAMLESAVADCRDALKASPNGSSARDYLGLALLKLGRLDEALNEYDLAVTRNKGSDALYGRAIVRSRRGDAAGSRLDRAEALKRDAEIEERFADYGVKL